MNVVRVQTLMCDRCFERWRADSEDIVFRQPAFHGLYRCPHIDDETARREAVRLAAA